MKVMMDWPYNTYIVYVNCFMQHREHTVKAMRRGYRLEKSEVGKVRKSLEKHDIPELEIQSGIDESLMQCSNYVRDIWTSLHYICSRIIQSNKVS
jgi:hypothetical protein